MTRRPDKHTIADLAVDAVTNICHECGWACEPIRADYGEDLLVQPVLDELVDDCRIWIQVKGSRSTRRYKRRAGHLSFPVDFDHARKWVRSADLVVVVLWDVEERRGHWTIPLDTISEWDWYLLNRHQARLRFPAGHVFDSEALLRLGWRARSHHYSMLLNNALASDGDASFTEEVTGISRRGRRSRVPLIAFDFLSRVQLLSPAGIHPDVLQYYRNALPKMEVDPAKEGTTPELMAGMLAMMAHLERSAPGVLLGPSALEIFGQMATIMILEESDPGSISQGRITIPGLDLPTGS